jgi:Na+/H+ antiporter NhaD/arsenite permease-like protein
MSIGAILVMVYGIIPLESALKSINLQVIGFLFGMFSITTALEKSGVINWIIGLTLAKLREKTNNIIIMIVFLSGILSAFIVNDTAAILLVPFAISICNQMKVKPSIVLISIAIGINVGSVMTPIGSPQNLLIASQSGIPLPFISFVSLLGPPTIINLLLSGLILQLYYKKELIVSRQQLTNQLSIQNHQENKEYKFANGISEVDRTEKLFSNRLAKISTAVFLCTLGAIVSSEIGNMFTGVYIDIGIISLAGALVLYIVSGDRISILKSVNYSVIVFFICMFIFTAALWTSGLIPGLMDYFPSFRLDDNTTNNTQDVIEYTLYNNTIISAVSIFVSQILSNVPFVASYIPFMIQNGFDESHISEWMMLSAASTIAGNLTIIGAASTIIIMQTAESKGMKVFTFFEFFKIGSLLTVVNVAIYYLFLALYNL